MKIQKVKSREYKGKEYHKYRIDISPKIMKDAGLNGGDEVEITYEKGKIFLKKI